MPPACPDVKQGLLPSVARNYHIRGSLSVGLPSMTVSQAVAPFYLKQPTSNSFIVDIKESIRKKNFLNSLQSKNQKGRHLITPFTKTNQTYSSYLFWEATTETEPRWDAVGIR
jgi:hypothetical protein